jgi:hypothetical protein
MHQTAMLLVDAFQPEGFTTLAKDSIFMMPHLGVLAQVQPAAAMEVFERDCLIYLGTCVGPKGHGKPGKSCFSYEISGSTLNESGEMEYGQLRLLPLGQGETATVTVNPAKGFDFGAGSGRRASKEVKGGTVGLVLDARGRPLELPEDRDQCKQCIESWITALQLYPEPAAAMA